MLYCLDFWHFVNIFSLYFDRPVGMPKMEKVYLHNPSSEETITLVSISATTSHFHASFFQNRVSFFYFLKISFSSFSQIWMKTSLKEWLTAIVTHLEVLRYYSSSSQSKFELRTETQGVLTMLKIHIIIDGLTADLLCCWSEYISSEHL